MTPNIHSQCVTPLSKAWVVLAVAPVKVRVRERAKGEWVERELRVVEMGRHRWVVKRTTDFC
ncbi:hypothetical protein [Archangium sp.]|uniref:hypothetical protein n=1 Tax=Archangium sp. TaxID=1872627 RepID=UPI00286C59A8|nr:hypothetical protein [Archangium sp.]